MLQVPVDSVLLTVEQGSGWFREMAIFLWSWGKGATKVACHKWASLFGANSACITYHTCVLRIQSHRGSLKSSKPVRKKRERKERHRKRQRKEGKGKEKGKDIRKEKMKWDGNKEERGKNQKKKEKREEGRKRERGGRERRMEGG